MTPQPDTLQLAASPAKGQWFAVLVSLAIIVPITLITEFNPDFVLTYGEEDGVAEYLTALFFFLSAFGFLSLYLQYARPLPLWRGLVILAWAALMFFFAGEELSWGQRIIGMETPESIRATNAQNEFNFHNHDIIQDHGHRILTAFTLLTGLGIWLLSLVPPLRRLYQQFVVPIPPLGYAILFVGAFIYGRRYIPDLDYFATEFRELFMACGMLGFAWHARLFGPGTVLVEAET
ncbi:MAG: hypothetical protein AAGG11_21615 [Pseudomonadota bacterium]